MYDGTYEFKNYYGFGTVRFRKGLTEDEFIRCVENKFKKSELFHRKTIYCKTSKTKENIVEEWCVVFSDGVISSVSFDVINNKSGTATHIKTDYTQF